MSTVQWGSLSHWTKNYGSIFNFIGTSDFFGLTTIKPRFIPTASAWSQWRPPWGCRRPRLWERRRSLWRPPKRPWLGLRPPCAWRSPWSRQGAGEERNTFRSGLFPCLVGSKMRLKNGQLVKCRTRAVPASRLSLRHSSASWVRRRHTKLQRK